MTRFILPNKNRNGIPSFVGAIGSGTLNQSLIIFREKLTHIYITGGVFEVNRVNEEGTNSNVGNSEHQQISNRASE
jgi:hypothetical protein